MRVVLVVTISAIAALLVDYSMWIEAKFINGVARNIDNWSRVSTTYLETRLIPLRILLLFIAGVLAGIGYYSNEPVDTLVLIVAIGAIFIWAGMTAVVYYDHFKQHPN